MKRGCREGRTEILGADPMLRRVLSSVAMASVLLGSLDCSATVGEQTAAEPKAPTPVATILATPDTFEGREVTVRGSVVKMKPAVFPNGRAYYTLSVGDERAAITVFTWEAPSVKPGDQVEAVGVFHVWRYNVPQMIESCRITKVGP